MERLIFEITTRSKSLLYDIAKEVERRQPSDIRAAISAVNGLRAIRIAESIVLLVEHYRWEEGRALLRSLVELIINGAYLRTASEEEVTNYIEFDNAKTWHYVQKLEARNPPNGPSISAFRSEAKRIAGESASKMTRDPKDLSWSSCSVNQRATLVDNATGETEFQSLITATWNLCHNFVHSSFSSTGNSIDWLNNGEYPANSEQVRNIADTTRALNHALWTYCKYLNSAYDLQLDRQILELAALNATVS